MLSFFMSHLLSKFAKYFRDDLHKIDVRNIGVKFQLHAKLALC